MDMKKVVIDPGHAPGNPNKGSNGFYEYQGMWKISTALQDALKRCGIDAFLTRTEDSDLSLSERGRCASGASLFISEHSNAFNGEARGVECFYSVRQGGNKANAQMFSKAVSVLMGTLDRGAKTRTGSDGVSDYYTVINSAVAYGCPHIFLIENGFHDNEKDESFLLQDNNLRRIAETQANVICSILGVPYKDFVSQTWEEEVAEAVEWAVSNNISSGERLKDNITREEAIVMHYRASK